MPFSDGFPPHYTIWLSVFLDSLPRYRKLLAKYFKRFKVSRGEYETWLDNRLSKLSHA